MVSVRMVSPGFVPSSTRRPHWVLLGRASEFGRSPRLLDVHGRRLVAFGHESDEGRRVVALPDACPHRGASLAQGGIVRGGCVVCPYHGRAVPGDGAGAFDTVTDAAGDAWLDFGSALASQHFPPPPPPPEFTDPGYRVVAYAKDLAGVNPVVLTENTLDHAHLFHVHAVHFVPGPPKVRLAPAAGGSGLATYRWAPNGRYQLTIENEYALPFTTSLRFLITDTQTGERLPGLVLWFSAAPTAGGVRLHLRIARASLTSPAFDWLFRLVDELPLAEDAAIVRTVDARAWGANALTPDDAFVAQYRAAMVRDFPDVLRHYVHWGAFEEKLDELCECVDDIITRAEEPATEEPAAEEPAQGSQ
jgi:hypothetical protein